MTRLSALPRFDSRHRALLLALALASSSVAAFNSGSTGADGAFNPTVNTTVTLPESGILNYTSINIPSGVTVWFRKNTTNTPVVLLVSGNVTIAGTIDISGGYSNPVGAASGGNVGDDGVPGAGAPGGYAGGRGGRASSVAAERTGGNGLGPGGGSGGTYLYSTGYGQYLAQAGGHAGFGVAGNPAVGDYKAQGGPAYGSSNLLPLVGGSGGGGGAGGVTFAGSGGSGGGGAIMISASGTINITGGIYAQGGWSGYTDGDGRGAVGGAGSGGAIRLVGTTIAGNGTIYAGPGAVGWYTGWDGQQRDNAGSTASPSYYVGGRNGEGSVGRIRLEAETFTRTAASTPTHSFGAPGPIFISGMPTLKIASIAGVAVPDQPSGVSDVNLPATTANPVAVTFATTAVPVGNTIKLTVTPASGSVTSATSGALSGTTDAATASVNITLPQGPSTLLATVTYTVVAALGDALSTYADNERVEKVQLMASLDGKEQRVRLITVSGKEFLVPAAVLAVAAG